MNSDTPATNLPPFPPDYRACGVLLHVTSLPSPHGIGDLGPAAFAWIDFLREAGQTWWQALPGGPTGYANSPYQSLSSFAGNWLLISPARLVEDGLVSKSDCEGPSFPARAVDYDAVITFKHRLLDLCWFNFSAVVRRDLGTAYEAFCHCHARWLNDYALFRALKVKYKGTYYLEWPTELVQRSPSVLAQVRRELAREIDKICFAQFLLFRQDILSQPRLDLHIRGHFLCQPIVSIAAPWLKLKAQEGPFAITLACISPKRFRVAADRTVAPKGDRTHSARTADGRSTRLPLAMRVPRFQVGRARPKVGRLGQACHCRDNSGQRLSSKRSVGADPVCIGHRMGP